MVRPQLLHVAVFASLTAVHGWADKSRPRRAANIRKSPTNNDPVPFSQNLPLERRTLFQSAILGIFLSAEAAHADSSSSSPDSKSTTSANANVMDPYGPRTKRNSGLVSKIRSIGTVLVSAPHFPTNNTHSLLALFTSFGVSLSLSLKG